MINNFRVETTEDSERRITENASRDNINTVIALDILLLP
jgi:hypothetical protein